MSGKASSTLQTGSSPNKDKVAKYALFYILSPQHWSTLRPWIRRVGSSLLFGALVRRLLKVDTTYPERFFWGLIGLIRCAIDAVVNVTVHRLILRSNIVASWSAGRQMCTKVVENVVTWMLKKMREDRTHGKPIREALEFLAAPIVNFLNAWKGFSRKSLSAAGVGCEIVCRSEHLKLAQDALNASKHTAEHDRILWIVHIHGGGFVLVGMATGNVLAVGIVESVLAHTDIIPVIIAVDYTMSPEGVFPEALTEVHKVYKWLSLRPCNKNPKIMFTGDSAGGNLALSTALALNGDRNGQPYKIQHPRTNVIHEFELGPQPMCMALFSPMLDARPERSFYNSDDTGWLSPAVVNSFALEYIGHHSSKTAEHQLASPLYACRLAEVAPVLLQCGDAELFYKDCNSFFEVLASASHRQADKHEVYADMGHAFHIGVLVGCGIARKALDNTALYIHQILETMHTNTEATV